MISAGAGFLLRKTGALAALVLALFLGYLVMQALVPAFKEAMTEREQLLRTSEERAALEEDLERLRSDALEDQTAVLALLGPQVEAEIAAAGADIVERQEDLARSLDAVDTECGLVEKVLAWVLPSDACDAARKVATASEAALDTAETRLAEAETAADVLADPTLTPEEKVERLRAGGEDAPVEREIEATEAELAVAEAEEERLSQAQSSGLGWVLAQWAKSWRWLATVALLVLVLPWLVRILNYFVLMPLVARAQTPFRLADGEDDTAAGLTSTPAESTLRIRLGAGQVLSARSEHVRPVQGKVRSLLLYDRKAPFISFAAGLHGLSRLTGDDSGAATATLATPDDPDANLMRIDFENHPGVVMRPTHVVGVIGHPSLETRWRWGIAALATWQVRYIMFAGTGSLIVEGCGQVTSEIPEGRPMKMDQNLVMGFDSRLLLGVKRTEAFLPYLRGNTSLVVDEFQGDHPFFWQKSTTQGPSNPLVRTFNAFFSGFGKLLGF